MDVRWRDLELLDAGGRVSAPGAALLQHELGDERVAVVTLLGSRATGPERRWLLARLLRQPEAAVRDESAHEGPGGVRLMACAASVDDDRRVLLLDVAGASSPVVGGLCALSSLVLCVCDSPTARLHAPPAFPPLREALEQLQRELTAPEVFEVIPNMLTIDLNAGPQGALHAGPAGSDLERIARLKLLPPQGLEAIADADATSFLAANAPVKRLHGSELTAEMLLGLLEILARDAVDDAHVPDLSGAWDELIERKCTAVAEDALATYVECLQASARETPPMEREAFDDLHDELWRLAMDVYHGSAMWRAPSRRIVRSKLKADLKKRYQEELGALKATSRTYCDTLRRTLWQETLERCRPRDDESEMSFRDMLHAIRQFDVSFKEKARGPEKGTVLSEFYQHEAVEVFQQLETIVTQKLSEAHLKELREQLTLDFNSKKDALVEHFKQEEAQLRVCMAREMEMMQKLHQAKTARVKMDENETKRLRDEVVEAKAQNEELIRQRVVLEHAIEDAMKQKHALEARVEELELAVRQEMSSRTELVETLAATIKAAEGKESSSQERIAELEVQLNEKAARVETELRDMTHLLKKTVEEKEELQKKLNEFFLRVTALPASLQQHLFCTDGSSPDQVQFADALSSYMSE